MNVPPSADPSSGPGAVPRPHRRRRRWIAAVALVAVATAAVVVAHVTGSSSPPSTVSTAYSIFGDAVPVLASAADDKPVELGLRFTTASAGTITAIRFYQGPQNAGPHQGDPLGPGR